MSLHPRTHSRLAMLLGLFLLVLAPAAAADGPVVVTVAAEDESTALEQGLEQALVRLAGLRSEPGLELVEALLDARDDAGWIAALERRQQVEDDSYRLEFDRFRLRTALRDAGVPSVLGERPGLLVWAVHERGGQRDLLGDAVDGPGILSALGDLAAARDMPLLFPLGDLQDRRAAQPSDIVGGVTEPLVEAARRYDADGVVLLHVRETTSGAEARAIAVHDGREYRSAASGEDPGSAAHDAVARGLDQVAERLARVAAEPEWLRLGFAGVQGYGAFERLRAELTRLQAVETARLDSLAGDSVVLQVRTGLEQDDLIDLLRGSGFARAETPEDAAGADAWLDRR
ncbi:DUF2066 domain-containing protein [Thioalkalivibrio sp. AKL7]|uniref:DUF2066 domain-containing protein n=1 Tax=Thioalkalivibrio sp. AKL7 TaxID=1158155 RepID=UPI000476FDBC|nr:DUF2066 domain-containing protein [Thioalkalivibrio sp. AKL7]